MNLLRRITIKGVLGGEPKKVLNIDEHFSSTLIVRLAGVLKKFDWVDTPYGASLKLMGNFKAINLLTNDEFKAANVFLPGVASDVVEMAIDANEGKADGLAIAFDIGIEYMEKGIGYAYTVKPLLEFDIVDSVDNLFKSLPKLATKN